MNRGKFDPTVGKTIQGITVKESRDGGSPRHQVFFEFTDGTYFELYSSSQMIPTTLGRGGRPAVERYMASGMEVVYQIP